MDCKGLGTGNNVISGTLSTFAWKELWKISVRSIAGIFIVYEGDNKI
jgi:hypothetical protein